ncbi:MAG: hypothetical protein AB7H77_00490, partial [Bdellovibrionales bacterium]
MLNAKLKEAAFPGTRRLIGAIEKYEARNNKTVRLNESILQHFISGARKRIGINQWTVLIATLDDWSEYGQFRGANEKTLGSASPVSASSPESSSIVIVPSERPSRFATFNSPHFKKQDAVGDSMFSLLTNAERTFFHEDSVGLKANLRKFAEVFIHRTLLTADGRYLDKIGV